MEISAETSVISSSITPAQEPTAISYTIHRGEFTSIATSLAARYVIERSLEDAKEFRIIPHLVSDETAVKASLRFLEEYRTVVEPACAASLSAVYEEAEAIKNYRNIVVEVCGGANVPLSKLMAYRDQFGLN